MLTIEIKGKYKKLISRQSIERYMPDLYKLLGIDAQSDLSILIDSDSALQKLNAQFLGYDQPTDVLSFESHEINPETGNVSIGDIAISYPTAERQSVEAGHSVENEIMLLLIHGLLHLSGYDHNTEKEKQVMWEKQQLMLDSLGIKINRISGDEAFHD